MTRSVLTVFLLLALAAPHLAAQSAADRIAAGDRAAAADRHTEAIASYEQALRQQPSLRTELSAKIGRQYLWAGKTKEAITWLREFVTAHPGDCDVRFDYAMALSWNEELRSALREYQMVRDACPARRQQSRLRIAQIYRWQDRPSEAEALYRKVLTEGTEQEQRDARIALGFVELDKDQNRSATQVFREEHARGASASIDEGAAIAAVRLADPPQVEAVLQRSAAAGTGTHDLLDLRGEWDRRDHFSLTPRATAFRDADGTSYFGSELAGSVGWSKRGRAEVALGASRLELDSDGIDDRWVAGRIDHRFSPSFALVAAARVNDFDTIDFQPVTGELDLVMTPSDHTRIDASAARIIIGDNLAALRAQLEGTMLGVGLDQRLSFRTTMVVAADVTRWNTDNERRRYRFNLMHRFEGVSRLTVEWPTLYQTYDEPFPFILFSPRKYVETGPALNIYRRFARVWNIAAYARGGVQQEDDLGWKGLATTRLSLERDLHDVWAATAALTWTNSNVASSTGFRRTAGTLTITRRF